MIFILFDDLYYFKGEIKFGYHYLEILCQQFQVEMVVASREEINKTIQEKLAEDLLPIIHSFCGRLYGLRKKQKKEINRIQEVREDEISEKENI